MTFDEWWEAANIPKPPDDHDGRMLSAMKQLARLTWERGALEEWRRIKNAVFAALQHPKG